jgi:alpha-L-fucosidase
MGNWFSEAGLGVFVHWGHSSSQGWELSWPLAGGNAVLPYCQDIPVDEYFRNAATFDPADFDPQGLAKTIKDMGATYAVLTAKHHDGFAMYPTRYSDHSIAATPYGKDIVGPFIDAVRAEGLKVGLYFSLIDWHHPDYPPITDADKPYNVLKRILQSRKEWPRYLEFMFGQIRELLTWYGKIDIIWFDGAWERKRRDWKPRELAQMIRSLQPGILINDRLPGQGDFTTPEQFIPHKPPRGKWETCMTMNESWGYNPSDGEYKTVREIVHNICEVTSKGGNMLINLSPRGDGTLPPEQVERAGAVGEWMERNGESVVGTRPGLEPWQFYGPSTRRKKTVYLHLLYRPYETVKVRGIRVKRVKSATVLGSGRPLEFTSRISVRDELLHIPWPKGELTIRIPEEELDPVATIIALGF